MRCCLDLGQKKEGGVKKTKRRKEEGGIQGGGGEVEEKEERYWQHMNEKLQTFRGCLDDTSNSTWR